MLQYQTYIEAQKCFSVGYTVIVILKSVDDTRL